MKPVNYILFMAIVILAGCAKQTPENYNTYIRYQPKGEDYLTLNVDPPKDGDLYSKGLKSGFFMITPYADSIRKYEYYNRIYSSFIGQNKRNFIEIKYNDRVQYFIDFFVQDKRELFQTWLERSQLYIPEMVKILREHNIPDDLVYLPLIESGFNPKAMSPAYAVGQWQFIKSTGKRYGLEINGWIDERMDWEKSTKAAANYMEDLYGMFHNWELVLAAYNCGEDRVSKLLDKHNSNNYWDISHALPRETRNYVPVYMAALIIAKNPEKYGFHIKTQKQKPEVAKVSVPPQKSIKKISEIIGVDEDKIEELNPSLISDSTPPGTDFDLIVPKDHMQIALAKYDEMAALKDATLHRNRAKYIYTVRYGDSLWEIARKHRVSVTSIKIANNLSGNVIRKGQRLTIPGDNYIGKTPRKTRTYAYKVKPGQTLGEIAINHGVSVSTIKRYNGIKGTFIKAGQTLRIPTSDKVISYKIKKGDTLWDIASKYRVKVADIKKWNKLSDSNLTIGQDLRIFR